MMKRTTKVIKTSLVSMLLVCSLFSSVTVVEAKEKKEEPKVIVIDPAFQKKADTDKEPIGPGAFTMCDEQDSGAVGKNSGYHDYDLTLQVALKLQKNLEDQGYIVLLTRSTNDVNISNSGRAMIANVADADLFIVVSTKTDGKGGVEVVCQSEENPYNYGNYNYSRLLSDAILGSMQPGVKAGDVVEDDDMAIMNWCEVPSTVVKVGSLENKDDEKRLVSEEYQEELASGIAAGVDSYFAQK